MISVRQRVTGSKLDSWLAVVLEIQCSKTRTGSKILQKIKNARNQTNYFIIWDKLEG
jgi:hypothetical protein